MTTAPSDVPTGLSFVDPSETGDWYRVVLWAAPGEGKSVGAATAPDPILVLSADRPGAYRFARRHHQGKDIRETRWENSGTLGELYKYLRDDAPEIQTVVIDPFHNIYDSVVGEIAGKRDPQPEHYQQTNKKLLGFLYSLRPLNVHVVLVAHERLSEGKNGDGKLYPQLGGPALINKVLAESDIVAHVEREPGASEEDKPRYMAQLTPRGNLVCKESTGALGDRREIDLAEWFAEASAVDAEGTADLPWAEGFEGETLADAVESGEVATEPVEAAA